MILAGSPRIGGNSDLLCDAFMRGALESGNIVEKINLHLRRLHHALHAIIVKIMMGNVYITMICKKKRILVHRNSW